MAKKKINNVVIKDEELTPTTLGVYSNKTKNPIGLLILIAMFIAIAFYLPNIQSYYNKLMGKSTSDNNNQTNNTNVDDDNDDDDVIDDNTDTDETAEIDIATTDSVVRTSYSLNNISLDGTTFKFVFENKGSSFNLSDYYLEFYTSEGTLVNRVKVSNETVSANDKKNFSFTVPANVARFTFMKKTLDDYPTVELNYNENREGYLTCKSGSKTYTYLFLDDSLKKVTYLFNLSRADDPNYNNVYQEYQSLSTNYNLVDGVTSQITSNEVGFNFVVNIDLSTADLSKINDDNIYKAKTTPKEVKFVEESKGYICQ